MAKQKTTNKYGPYRIILYILFFLIFIYMVTTMTISIVKNIWFEPNPATISGPEQNDQT